MKKKLILLAAALLPLISQAQDKKEVPTKETPSKIKVYTPSSSVSKSSSSNNAYKWAVKTDVFKFISSEFPIIFEYRIASKFSVEGSAAVTYAFYPNDFMLSEDENDSNTFESKSSTGSAFRGAIKYYPSSDYDAIEGWSFGIQVFTKTTNREYQEDSSFSEFSIGGEKDTKTKTGISLIIGKQIFQDSNITFESFFGIGMSNVSREFLTYEYNDVSQMNELKTINTKESVPSVQLGLRIGFGN